MYKIVLTSLSIILLSSANSYSQNSQSEKTDTLNINYFIDNLTDRLEDFLASSGRGIEATNLWLQLHDRKPIYCPPENIVLTGKQYGQILRSIVEKNPATGYFEVQYVHLTLIGGLRDTFPCPDEK